MKIYEKPELSLKYFEMADVIMTSNANADYDGMSVEFKSSWIPSGLDEFNS